MERKIIQPKGLWDPRPLFMARSIPGEKDLSPFFRIPNQPLTRCRPAAAAGRPQASHSG